MMKLSG